MSTRQNNEPTPPSLEDVIGKLLLKIHDLDPTTDEYAKVANQLKTVHQAWEIASDIKTKNTETQLKQNESTHAQTVKNEELTLKQQESAAALTHKAAEVLANNEEHMHKMELLDLDVQIKKKEADFPLPVKPETLAIIAANLVGIGMIMTHERFNIVTTKAISWIPRLFK